jgi:acyl-CoA synthetase (AMP-forming)/AMP-acid ligase II
VLDATIRYGGTTVLIPRFEVEPVIDAIEKQRATIFPGEPTMFTALLHAATEGLVIRGGYNVYPREVEEVLHEHPAVAEAAVIGKQDDRLGEEVVAVVSLKPGEQVSPQDVIAFCKERMAAYKYPREVRVLPELPKGPTGKILKKELR